MSRPRSELGVCRTQAQTLLANFMFFTVHLGMILVYNQLDAQFFMYVYLYSPHVSGSHVPIIRRIIVSMRHLVCVTLKQVNGLKLQIYALK